MKIFHLINDINIQNGGAQRVVRMLHHHHLKRGIESHVVSLQANIEEPVENHFCLDVHSLYSPKTWWKIRRFLKTNCSDRDVVLNAHLFPTNFWVANATRFGGFPGVIVCTEHSTSNGRRGKWIGKPIDRLIYPRYQKIICISEATEKSLADWVPSVKTRTVVIENGSELSFSDFPARPGTQELTVVSAGRLSRPKNYEAALRAIASIKELPFCYRIAGCGPLESDLKQLTIELGIEDKVGFCGFVHDLSDFLRQADIFLMPSLWEGFGLSAVEAMNAGLPVIASDVEGLREVVDEDCALLVDPSSPDSIASAIRTLVAQPETRMQLGENGFKRSFLFSADKMADRYLELYQSELESR